MQDNKTTTNTNTPKKEPSKTLIYVSNLPFETTDEQFRDLFKGFPIKTAYIAKRKNGRSKGFGFVNLEKDSDQKAAIEKVNGLEFEKRKLIAKIAMDDERRNEQGELKEEFKSQTNNQTVASDTVVYVSNLEWSVTNEELKKIFAEYNPKNATVATRRNGKSKGFGFVEFNTKEDQEKALKLDNQKIGGRDIIVKASTGYRGDKPQDSQSGGNKRVPNVKRRTDFTLYVSNLPLELDDNDLRDVFQEFHPKSARIITRSDGKSRGYGFVEFDNSKDQNDALSALDQSEINERVVTVKVSTSRQGQSSGGRRNNNRGNNIRRNNNNNNRDNNRGSNNRSNNNNNNRGNNNNNNRRNYNNNNNNNNNRDNNRNNNRSNNNNNNNNRQRPERNENREKSSNMVYVSNLPFTVDDKALEEVFKGLKITKAYIATRRNGFSKGFGFVEFASPEDQQKAINFNGNEVSGRSIVVQAAFKVDQKTN